MAFLREMMLTEVGISDINKLVLMTRGRELPRSLDMLSLEAAGICNDQKIIISTKLGSHTEIDRALTRERNKKLVGDILFRTGSDLTKSPEAPRNSILMTFMISHGYQIIGLSIERLILSRISDAFIKEETAKHCESELYALLDKEVSV